MKTRLTRTMQAFILGCIALLSLVSTANAQYYEKWVATYNGQAPTPSWEPTDWVNDMVVHDGYIYVTGYESAATAYWATVKYNYSGQELWVQRLEDGQSQTAEAMAVDTAGNVYVTGYQKQFSAGGDVATMKYSPDGDSLWKQLYVSPGGNNQPNDMEIDASGNIYIAGASWVTAQQDFDLLLLKYDPNGNLLWDETLDNGDGQLDTGYELAIDTYGNVIVAGFSEPEAYLVKYNSSGDLLWQDEHEGYSTNDDWRRVDTDSVGNIYVLGEISPPGESNHLWTAKYDPDGNILWEDNYTGTADKACYAGNLTIMQDGGVVITGQSWDLPNHISIITIRYGPDGTKLWQQLEKAGYTHASGDDVALDTAGNIYITGYGYDYSYQEDIITLSYSADGTLLWTKIYASPDSTQSDYPKVIAVDEDANVFVTGSSWEFYTSNNYTTIRYTDDPFGLQVTAEPAEICLGDSVQLKAIPDGGSGTYTYTWTSDPPGFCSSEPEPMVCPTENTTYFCDVDDGWNIVSGLTEVTITLVPEIPEKPNGDTLICEGVQQTIYDTDGSVGSDDYIWSLEPEDAGTIDYYELIAIVTWEKYVGTAEISVIGINDCGESDTSEVLEVELVDLPDLWLGDDIEVCEWETVLLDAGVPGASYLWSTGETTQTIQVDSSGVGIGTLEVWVEVTDTCMNRDTIMVDFMTCVGIIENANWSIDIYPNPSNGQFKVELNSKSKRPAQLSIINAFGSEVYKESEMIVSGTKSKTISLPDIPKGIYFLKLYGDGVNIIKKIVIQ